MPEPSGTADEVRRELAELRDELRSMADELEDEIRASSFDVRDRFSRLLPRLEEFEERSRATSRAWAPHLKRTAIHLRAGFAKLRADCGANSPRR